MKGSGGRSREFVLGLSPFRRVSRPMKLAGLGVEANRLFPRLGDFMEFVECPAIRLPGLPDLFRATFAASEGAAEGEALHRLVVQLLAGDAPGGPRVFVADEGGVLSAACVFTPLAYQGDVRRVRLLSPLAVLPSRQRRGVGRGLAAHGLAAMRAEKVDLVMTYGDPAFYGRLGFAPMRESDVPAPFPLSRPEGWQGIWMTDRTSPNLKGPVT